MKIDESVILVVTCSSRSILIYNLHANARIDNPIEGKESSLMLLEDLSNDDRGQQVVKNKFLFYLQMSQLPRSVDSVYWSRNVLKLNM